MAGGATFATGKSGQTFAFNGTDALVSVPDAPSLRPTSLTLEAWALFTSTPSTGQNIIGKSIGTSGFDSYAIWYGQGGFKGAVADSGGFGTILNYAFNPSLGQWYHLAYTFDGNTKQQALYVNGALAAIAIGSKSPGYNTKPFFIGGDIASSGTGFACFFPGLIDEPAIYPRALSGRPVD